MAPPAPTLSFSFSSGAIIATAPFFHRLPLCDSSQHGAPTTSASVIIASASECDALGPQNTTLLLRCLSQSVSHPPIIILANTNMQGNTLFWPHAQHARARVRLSRTKFQFSPSPSTPSAFEPLQQLHSSVDIDALLQLARTAATFSPQYASVVDDLYHITHLIQQTHSSISVQRQTIIIRLVAVARLDPRDHRVLTQANSLVLLDPTNPSSYLPRAQARCAAKQYWPAVLDVWYSVLILDLQPSAQSRLVSLLERCLPHVPHIGLDVVFVLRTTASSVQDCFPAPYDCLTWDRLSSAQQKMHYDIIKRVWLRSKDKALPLSADRKAVLEYASTYAAFICSSGMRQAVPTAVKLPQMFMWLVPLRLAGSAMISTRAQITAMESVGFTLIVSLTIEQPLQSSWFKSCRNLFLPMRRGRTPSFHQIDVFAAQAADAKMTLIHCMEGKSRTALLMGVWLMLFGFSSGPSLCSKCTSANGLHETNQFIGCCKDPTCALTARHPVMSAQEAIEIVKRQRAGLAMSYDQEKFLNDYNAELWRRYGLLHDLDASAISSELVYPRRISTKEDDAELQVNGRPMQNVPSLIVLCGLPGSGKSFLANRISRLNPRMFAVACQDTLGSRDSCFSSVSNAVKRGRVCAIVDRCNPKLSDREEWLHCAFCPSSAIIVHLDIPPEQCTVRAERRVSHPTLIPSSAGHVIQGVSKCFEVPGDKDLHKGFDAIYVIRGRVSFETFLTRLRRVVGTGANGTLEDESLDSEQDEKESMNKSGSSSLCLEECNLSLVEVETDGSSAHFKGEYVSSTNFRHNESSLGFTLPQRQGCNGNTRSHPVERCSTVGTAAPRSERPIRLSGFVKFPRTRHILNLGGGVTDDDLVMDSGELAQMIAILNMTRLDKNMKLTIEEKVDGANLGFSICPESGKVLVQNRSHYVNTKSHLQFKLIKFFVETYEEDLRKVLRDGERILYGEWMYAKHSILYSKLPSIFLAFDLFDKEKSKFLSRAAFRRELEGTRICSVEQVRLPNEITISSIKELALNCESHYYEGPAEGLYFRIDRDGWLVDRAKIVRPDFIASNEHWTRRAPERNKFESL